MQLKLLVGQRIKFKTTAVDPTKYPFPQKGTGCNLVSKKYSMSSLNYIAYQDGEATLEGFSASFSQEKSPLVILCHAWRGRDPFIEEKAKQIAELGFVGFALDMYGKGVLGKSKEENAALKKPFMEDRGLLQRRVLKGYEEAIRLPHVDSTRVAVLGFGFGAVCALDLARTGVPLKGTISFYGHFDPPRNCPQKPMQGQVLILHGANDPIAPLSELQRFEHELERAHIPWKAHIYENTYHAFMAPGVNDPTAGLLYNPDSATKAWQSAANFLKEVLIVCP